MLPGVRRGILGGTFDPPHLAHLVAAEAAMRQLRLDVATFLPAGAPWQKAGEGVSAAEHRLAMTRLAVEDIDYFDVDDREVRRDGWTYTADTVEAMGDADELTLVLGADAAAGLDTWHRTADLKRMVQFAVVPRPRVAFEEVARALTGTAWVWLDAPELDISSTDLRRRSAAGQSVRFLVPERVRGYITENRLYLED